jgi:phenylacetaldehyde dehydrogenase
MANVTLSESVREYTEGDVRMLIGDTWPAAGSGETFPVFDPATGAEIARAPRGRAGALRSSPAAGAGATRAAREHSTSTPS